MNENQRRIELQNRINELTQALDEAETQEERDGLLAQIAALEREVDLVDVRSADALGARIDAILADIGEVLNARPLDAASALGRAVDRLRNLRQRLGET